MGAIYAGKKYEVERDRLRMWDRVDNLKNKEAHHFSNRGGVLFEKHFVGFEKYFRDEASQMEWYAKAFPK